MASAIGRARWIASRSPLSLWKPAAAVAPPPTWTLRAHTGQALGANGGTTTGIDTSLADLIIVGNASFSQRAAPTINDSRGNTITQILSQNNGVNCLYIMWFIQGVGIGGPGHTFTLSGVQSFDAINIQAWSGSIANPLDGSVGGNAAAGSVSLTLPNLTPSVSGDLMITGLGVNALETLAIDSGFTILDPVAFLSGNNFGSGMAYKVKADALVERPVWSWGSATDGAAVMAAFKV